MSTAKPSMTSSTTPSATPSATRLLEPMQDVESLTRAIDGAIDGAIDEAIKRAGDAPRGTLVISPAFAALAIARGRSRGATVRVVGVVGYPLGLNKSTIKAIEATSLAKEGVDALEITPNPIAPAGRLGEAVRAELLEILRAARAARPGLPATVRLTPALPLTTPEDATELARAIVQGAADGVVLDGPLAWQTTASAFLKQADPSLPLTTVDAVV